MNEPIDEEHAIELLRKALAASERVARAECALETTRNECQARWGTFWQAVGAIAMFGHADILYARTRTGTYTHLITTARAMNARPLAECGADVDRETISYTRPNEYPICERCAKKTGLVLQSEARRHERANQR